MARYEYDGLFRRIEKTVTSQGTGLVHGSAAGGITGIQTALDTVGAALRRRSHRDCRASLGPPRQGHEHCYWQIDGRDAHPTWLVEVRDSSDQTLGQYVWGVQYLDEPVRYDRNTDVGTDNDCVETADRAYFYHQDANYRVVMLTGEDGNVVERAGYTAYGQPTVNGG